MAAGIVMRTVDVRVPPALENAFEKLGVRTRTAAVAAAFGRPL
jgi:hypothetical protein